MMIVNSVCGGLIKSLSELLYLFSVTSAFTVCTYFSFETSIYLNVRRAEVFTVVV